MIVPSLAGTSVDQRGFISSETKACHIYIFFFTGNAMAGTLLFIKLRKFDLPGAGQVTPSPGQGVVGRTLLVPAAATSGSHSWTPLPFFGVDHIQASCSTGLFGGCLGP